MDERTIKDIEGYLLARFLTPDQIAIYAGVTEEEVLKVMMEIPAEWLDE